MNKFIMGLVVASGLLVSPVANAATFTPQQVETIVVLLQAFGYSAEDVAGIRAALSLAVEEEITNNNEPSMDEPVLGAVESEAVIEFNTAKEGTITTLSILGEWDTAQISVWNSAGHQIVVSSQKAPVEKNGQRGRFVSLNDLASGTYTYEVVAVKDGVEKTESGSFIVE